MRADLIRNPDFRYLFGDNEARKGFGGQAKEMRGCANAIGVRTKRYPGYDDGAYWHDSDESSGLAISIFEHRCNMINDDLAPAVEHIRHGGWLVIPTDGIGTGMARLEQNAPRVFRYLQDQIAALKELA